MMNHTPGPRRVGAEKSFVFMPNLVKPIACGSQANAFLIAAAPDLLAELKALAELAHNHMSVPESVWNAINKAEGATK